MDGRYNPKGEEKDDDYSVKTASQNEEYDFILISVASGKLKEAISLFRSAEKHNKEKVSEIE